MKILHLTTDLKYTRTDFEEVKTVEEINSFFF